MAREKVVPASNSRVSRRAALSFYLLSLSLYACRDLLRFWPMHLRQPQNLCRIEPRLRSAEPFGTGHEDKLAKGCQTLFVLEVRRNGFRVRV